MLNLYAPQSILPLLSASFGVSPVQAALSVTVTTLAVALVAPFAGAFSDSRGRKPVIVAALIGVSVPTLASALSTGLTALLVTRFCQGLFIPLAFTAALAYISEEWEAHERGAMTALYVTANVGGGFAGRFIGGLAADLGNWQAAFLALGALNLMGAGLVAAWMRPSRHFLRSAGFGRSLQRLPDHLRNPKLLAAFAVGFNVLFSLVAIFTYITFYLAGAPFRLGAAALGAIFATYLVGLVVTPLSGRLIDRFGQRRTLMAAMPLAMAGALLTLAPGFGAVLAGLAMCCTGIFLAQATATSFVARIARHNKSTAAGLYLSFYYLGGALGAVVPGLAYTRGGWPACVALAIAVQLIVIVIASVLWREPSPIDRAAVAGPAPVERKS